MISYTIRRVARALKVSNFLSRVIDGGDGEKRVIKALERQIRVGDVLWDVGANVGAYSVMMGVKVGDEGRVYAFEPHPGTFESLVDAAREENIICLNMALSDDSGEGLIGGQRDSATNSLATSEFGENQLTVEVETGDSVVEHSLALCPNGVKVDVEGYELKVSEGMGQTLLNSRVRFLVVEIHRRVLEKIEGPDSVRRIRLLLKSHGFRVRWIDSSHVLATRMANSATFNGAGRS